MIALHFKRLFLQRKIPLYLRNTLRCLASNVNDVEVQDRGAIRLIVLNRPEKRNALSTSVSDRILESLHEVDSNPLLKVTVLTGIGKVFCAGADLSEMSQWSHADAVSSRKFYDWTNMNEIEKPIIGAINGPAIAGGCELAMLCDILIASETAIFSQPETKLALIPGMGGTQRLTRAVGKSKAMELILTGDLHGLSATEALSYGLVSRVVPQDQVLEAAMSIAERIATLSSPVIIKAKKCVNLAFEKSLTDALKYEVEQFWSCFALEDSKEGIASFLERRQPNYKDK